MVLLSSWPWVLPVCSLFSPLFGCFDLFNIGRVHHHLRISYQDVEKNKSEHNTYHTRRFSLSKYRPHKIQIGTKLEVVLSWTVLWRTNETGHTHTQKASRSTDFLILKNPSSRKTLICRKASRMGERDLCSLVRPWRRIRKRIAWLFLLWIAWGFS